MNDENRALCPHRRACGGCQLLNLSYAEQLGHKQRQVIGLLGRFGHVEEIWGMAEPYHYRNKVHAAFALDRRRQIVSGIYQSSSHAVVKVDSCLLEDELADRIIVAIRGMLREFKLQVFDERSGTGWLRHVLVRRGFTSGQVMVVLVAASPIFKNQKPFLARLLADFPEITTVVLNVNDRFGSMLLGPKSKALYGPGYIEDELCKLKFRISPSSFYQINPLQTERLYAEAIRLAGLTGNETVLDAYCGVGTIGLCAASQARQVIGVELNADAVKDAIVNAKLNGIKNAWFTAGDAGRFMEGMAADGQKPDVVFMDPPRAGSDEKFLRSLLKTEPARVVYISCNPATMQRDLTVLVKGGYKVRHIQPVDMFPHTEHIETVCCLDRKKQDLLSVTQRPRDIHS